MPQRPVQPDDRADRDRDRDDHHDDPLATLPSRRSYGSAATARQIPPSVTRLATGPERTRTPDLSPGGRFGRYTVGAELGRGGMGVVVTVDDPQLRRQLAMKLLLRPDSPPTIDRFMEEAQITGQLEHPHIVPVHELGVDAAGRPWLTMKRVTGMTLRERLSRLPDGPLTGDTLRELLGIFDRVCDAVAFAHSRGVVHRDLKPDNVMLGEFGEVLVMDWGVAAPRARLAGQAQAPVATQAATVAGAARPTRASQRAISDRREASPELTADGDILGTPAYMPPEQAEGRIDQIDERTDIFALGGILYSMLTGALPYEGNSPVEVLVKAARRSLVPPRRRAPRRRVPRDLDAIAMKAMSAKRENRYASVADLKADLAAYLGYRPVSARRIGPLARAHKWTRRHPTATAVVTLLLVFGAVLTAVVTGMRAREARLAAEQERSEHDRRDAEWRALAAQGRFDELTRQMGAEMVAGRDEALEEFLSAWYRRPARQSDSAFVDSLGRDRIGRYLLSFDRLLTSGEALGVEVQATDWFYRGLLRQVGIDDRLGAVDDYTQALKLDPSLLVARYNRAIVLIDLQQDAAARADLQAVTEADPDHIQAFYNLARACERLGQKDEALGIYNRLIARDPQHIEALNNRGMMLDAAGRDDEALADYSAAIAIRPDMVEARVNRAALYLEMHMQAEAEADLAVALRADEDYANAWNCKGNLLREMGRLADAEAAFTRAIKLDERTGWFRANRGVVRMMRGDYDAALQDFNAAIEDDAEDISALYNRGVILQSRNDPAGAMRDYNVLLRVMPRHPQGRVNRGVLRLNVEHDAAGALADLDVAVQAKPDLWQGWVARAHSLADLGRKAEALESLDKGLECCPPDQRDNIIRQRDQLRGQ
ncbi:MAG: tetratricopeptide repeat protein [Planctomycetota bacterium]